MSEQKIIICMSISILSNETFINKISNSISSLKVDIQNLDDLFREHINNITFITSVEKDIISTQINFFVILFDYISSSSTNHSPYFSIVVNLKTLLDLLKFVFVNETFDANTKNRDSRILLLNAIESILSKYQEDPNTLEIYNYGIRLKQYSYAELNDILQSQIFNISDVMKLNVRNLTNTLNRYNIKNFNYIQTTKLRFLSDLFENSITNLNYSSNDSLYSSLAIVSGLFVTILNILAPNYNVEDILNTRYQLQYQEIPDNADVPLSLFQYILFSVFEMFDFMQFYVLASFNDNPNNPFDDFKISINVSDYSINLMDVEKQNIILVPDTLNVYNVISNNQINNAYIKKPLEDIFIDELEWNKDKIDNSKLVILYQDPENQNAIEINNTKYSVNLLDKRHNLLKLRLSEDDTGLYLIKNEINVTKIYYDYTIIEGESGTYIENEELTTLASFSVEENIDVLRQFVGEITLENGKKIYESTFENSMNKIFFIWDDIVVKIYRDNQIIQQIKYENDSQK